MIQGGSAPCSAHHPSAGERPWSVWVGSPSASYLAPRVLASAAHNSALHFVAFSYCFCGFCLNISGTSREAQNTAIGPVSGSLAAESLLLSTALVPPSPGAGSIRRLHRQALGEAALEQAGQCVPRASGQGPPALTSGRRTDHVTETRGM